MGRASEEPPSRQIAKTRAIKDLWINRSASRIPHTRARLTGISKKTVLVRMGLEALIARESARRLAKLGGTEPGVRAIRRRRGS